MPKLVCVIDDDEAVRAKLALDLQSMGFETVEIDDSRKVNEILSSRTFDAVVVDIVMPNKDGIEVIGDIRDGWPQVRVIAISGGGRLGAKLYLELARQMGAHACLSKPIKPEDLRAALG